MKALLWGAMAAATVFAGSAVVPASAQEGDARVRILHASPDAPAVDIYVNGAEAVSDLAFSEITDYLELDPGSYDVAVYPASAGGSGDPVIEATVTLAASTDYTVAAAGALASIEPVVLTDDNSKPAAGQAHVRFVHLSPDAPAVDIAAAGAGVVIPNTAFKSAASYLPLPAATYDLDVRVAGTGTSALAVPGVALEGGKVYSVFALGFAGGGSPALSAKLVTDATHPATGSAPIAPNTGMGLAEGSGMNAIPWLLIGAGLIAAGIGSTALARRRAPVN